jgi:hypothetical protein
LNRVADLLERVGADLDREPRRVRLAAQATAYAQLRRELPLGLMVISAVLPYLWFEHKGCL